MMSPVDEAVTPNPSHDESTPGTLGEILYSDKSRRRAPEHDWVNLVRAIAAGDQLALHSLYELTHRMVFTLALRIASNRETAEEVTVDVFHDVWRKAGDYDPAGGSVVGWIMNQARSRAIDHSSLPLQPPASGYDPQQACHLEEQSRLLRNALEVLTMEERQVIETAFFSELSYHEVAVKLNQPPGTVKTRIRSGLGKLRQTLDKTLNGL
jgi:RNA polymerase sigma-70 factor (ECF subfamily)